MQAIITKYISPTNHRGARIKATAKAGSVTVPYDHAQDHDEPFRAAARALCAKFGWEFDHVSGGLPDESLVWVKLPKRPTLRERVQAIAQGDTWSATDLRLAMFYCETDAERESVQAYLNGSATTNDRFRLQEIAIKIGV
tara:strand:+ start:721 stop:1140 length:420 start_codon:yes stop_codon:yes gene_type:complete